MIERRKIRMGGENGALYRVLSAFIGRPRPSTWAVPLTPLAVCLDRAPFPVSQREELSLRRIPQLWASEE